MVVISLTNTTMLEHWATSAQPARVTPGLYTPGTVYGSANGSPDSRGAVVEFSWMPWLNTKFSAQYTAYNKFNGASRDYEGSGRTASDNNTTTFVYAWLIF